VVGTEPAAQANHPYPLLNEGGELAGSFSCTLAAEGA